jgi:hypothetical protein
MYLANTVYLYSMARKIVCPVCDGERFRKVVVTLPSGKDRVTDFEACLRCATVFYRPEPRQERIERNIRNYTSFVAAEVSSTIAKSFPDANMATVEMQSAYYKHPTFGCLVLTYKRKEIVGTNETGMQWHLVEAKRLTE